MTANNLVTSQEFIKRKEEQIKGVLISNLKLTGNEFRGSIVVEQDLKNYVVKVVFNFNDHVIVVKDVVSIYDGIDIERLVAKVAEEIAIHILINVFDDALKNDERVKYWLKKDTH